jgi:putative sigma-54 modulation protein
MQIDISTRHGQINPATKEKIIAKLEKLSRFQERLTAVSVIVDLSGDDSQVELKASVERTPDFVSHAKSSTLMGAVDGALQKMQEQMRRHKGKLVEHKSTGRRTEIPPTDEQQEPE